VGGHVLIQITPQMRILVAIESIDGRKGIDSLAQLCREKLDADPFSGCLFIFRSRSGKSIRILAYDSQGFWLATKRLSKGRFKWWPTAATPAKNCEPTRRSCSWRLVIRRPMRRRCREA
jgi:transposase